ncbi:hypothetical protein ASZ90_006968 [hydrocarbon metagenome]|uniref:Cytochrome b5 heme-binding domain-containing protein n=1 Tax=hydrocarbon metagenome TaxID=938273 RepID=A0A0W8FR40_9ZZZZ
MGTYNPESLAKHDGKNSTTDYVATGQKVFDVSARKLWKTGLHLPAPCRPHCRRKAHDTGCFYKPGNCRMPLQIKKYQPNQCGSMFPLINTSKSTHIA